MGTIPEYPPAVVPLTGQEDVPIWSNNGQKSVKLWHLYDPALLDNVVTASAQDSAAQAATSAAGAATSEQNAENSATNAATSAAGAATSEQNAENSETSAATSASGAANSASSAGSSAALAVIANARAQNAVPFATWLALTAASSMVAGDTTAVLASDLGTHTDPVVGGIVKNAGKYTYSASPAGWQRTGDLDSQTASAYVSGLGPLVYRGTASINALATGLYANLFAQASLSYSIASTQGAKWCALDCATTGGDITPDSVDAIFVSLSVAAAVTQLSVQVYEVITTDTNVNLAPPQSADVLVGSATITLASLLPLDGNGAIVAAVSDREFLVPLAASFPARAGYTYKTVVNGQDNTATSQGIAVGYRAITGNSRQRYSGGFKAATSSSTYSNLSTSYRYSMGLAKLALNSSTNTNALIAANSSAISGMSQTRLQRMLESNETRLYSGAGFYGKAHAGATYVFGGDSQVNNIVAGVDTGNTCADNQMQFLTPASWSNIAVGGTRTDQIADTFLAQSSSLYASFGVSNGGTNDVRFYASGVNSITISSPGTGGTAGTYPLAISGGTVAGQSINGNFAGTFTVDSSGGVVSYNLTHKGGGYSTLSAAPTLSTSACPGLTGAVLTPNLDVLTSVQWNIGRVISVSGGNRVVMAPYTGLVDSTYAWAMSRKIAAWEKSTYGALAWDPLPFIIANHSGDAAGLWRACWGYMGYAQTVGTIGGDALHPNDYGCALFGREWARLERAYAGIGPAYVHWDRAGVLAGSAVGTAVLTPRILGGTTGGAATSNYRIVETNAPDVVRINDVTGALTRGAATPPTVTEIFVEGDSKLLGKTNRARILLPRQSDDTVPNHIVTCRGAPAGVLCHAGLSGAAPTQKLTIVMLGRVTNTTSTTNGSMMTQDGVNGATTKNTIIKQGRYFQWNPYPKDSATVIANLMSPVPADWWNFCLWYFCMDTTAGVAAAGSVSGSSEIGISQDLHNTATPTANAYAGIDMTRTLYGLGYFPLGTSLFGGWDEQFFWMAPSYLDMTQTANQALFWNSATRQGVISDPGGVISGITPLVYMRGLAGDRLLGKNFGSGGDWASRPIVNLDNLGFVDLSS